MQISALKLENILIKIVKPFVKFLLIYNLFFLILIYKWTENIFIDVLSWPWNYKVFLY